MNLKQVVLECNAHADGGRHKKVTVEKPTLVGAADQFYLRGHADGKWCSFGGGTTVINVVCA